MARQKPTAPGHVLGAFPSRISPEEENRQLDEAASECRARPPFALDAGTRLAPPPSAALSREFYQRHTLQAARLMIGCLMVHHSAEGVVAGRIVETEAYLGPHDLGAHSSSGRPTDRTRAMFGPRGHAYMFLVYGMYWCFNAVTGEAPWPQAVLVRALEPLAGIDIMRARIDAARRFRPGPIIGGRPRFSSATPRALEKAAATLCQGPGKLCRAMGLDGSHYGADLTKPPLYLTPGGLREGERVASSPRVGIPYAGEWVGKPWRFYVAGHPAISGPKALGR